MNEQDKKVCIENYIKSYNNFDVVGMLKDLDAEIVFRNISNGEITLTTNGIDEFRQQAEKARNFFITREQKINSLKFENEKAEAEISYIGTLAVDLPNGLKAGSKIELTGKSVFRFNNGKIIEIEDIS